MASAWKMVACALVLTLAHSACGADPEPTREQIDQWIQDLGSDTFTVREKASQQLWKAGRAAEDALNAALKDKDNEVRSRSRQILDKFKWGIYPDTPREIVDHIQTYQGGTKDDKSRAVKALFALGSKGCAALVKIARADDDAEFRQDLHVQLSQEASLAVPGLLAESNFATLDELFELTLAIRADDRILQNYAAYWLLRDKIDDRIGHFKKLAEKEDDNAASQVLTYLYRAKGDRAALQKVVEKSGRIDVLQAALAGAGDWKALSKLVEKEEGVNTPEALGTRLAYHRLAGNADAYDKVLVELRKQADEQTDPDSLWRSSKALLLVAGPDEVIDRLAKAEKATAAFDILIARQKISEALEHADKEGGDGNGENQVKLRMHKARVLALLGERAKAAQVFGKQAKQLKEDASGDFWADDLIRNEFRAGFRDEAMGHLAELLAGARDDNDRSFLGLVFSQQQERAAVLWKARRLCRPEEKPAEALAVVTKVLENKMASDEVKSLLDEGSRKLSELQPGEAEGWLVEFGETALEYGLDEVGVKYLEQAARTGLSPAGHLKLGDHHAAKQEWQRAAEAYGQAHDKDPKQPMAAWLKGWSLKQGGKEKEGRKFMDLAHWIPLGDEQARHAFCKELFQHPGQEARAALEREVDLAERTGKPNSYYASEMLRLASIVAAEKKDYQKAADLQERSLLRVLSPYTEFVEATAHVSVPHHIHSLRARGYLAEGRVADARREIEYCQGLLPGHVDLAIALTPELEKKKEKKLADEVFARALAVNEKVCSDYPRSAGHHNNLAWLCACCKRELDKGLEHATTAVKLSPDNFGYLDTLAEVHFQKGDKDKAIELMKKCVAAEPKRGYYQKQLKRFEAGDRDAEVPPANDDD